MEQCRHCGAAKKAPWEKCYRCGDDPMDVTVPPPATPGEAGNAPEGLPDPEEMNALRQQKARVEKIRDLPPPSLWAQLYEAFGPLVGLWLIAVGIILLFHVLGL